jgi:hypothetical protein
MDTLQKIQQRLSGPNLGCFCLHTRHLHHPRMVNEIDILLHLSGSYLSLGIGAEHVMDVLFTVSALGKVYINIRFGQFFRQAVG